ncbi:MAG: RNA polymerase sigma factor, partial [Chloroflexus sp.]|nr:RNA polymerase sigma factor [Chloroflexus sp.]
ALEQLEPHYRLVLTLYYFEDLKYTDIAEILDLPLNTVKSHIRRGKERLAQLLQANDPPATRAVNQPAPKPVDDQLLRITPLRLLPGWGRR